MRITAMAFAIWLCLPLSVLANEWIDSGWQHINAGQYIKALETWQQGINQLDDKRLLASVGVYAHFPYAIAQLKQVGPDFGALIVRRILNDRLLYFVLSTRHVSANRSKRQLALADLKQAAGITDILIAVEASTIKLHPVPTDYLSISIVKPVLHAGKAEKTIGEKSARTAHRPATSPSSEVVNSFSINRFEINGNHHITTDIILMGLSDFYGSGKSQSDLKSIQNQVLEIYRMSGFYNMRVSTPQLVDDTIHINILEQKTR